MEWLKRHWLLAGLLVAGVAVACASPAAVDPTKLKRSWAGWAMEPTLQDGAITGWVWHALTAEFAATDAGALTVTFHVEGQDATLTGTVDPDGAMRASFSELGDVITFAGTWSDDLIGGGINIPVSLTRGRLKNPIVAVALAAVPQVIGGKP